MMKKIIDYYGDFNEKDRLNCSFGQIEFIRSQQIIVRYLPKAPAVVLDVGGAAGRYSCWLAGLGYEVHLIDPVPKHIEQANIDGLHSGYYRDPEFRKIMKQDLQDGQHRNPTGNELYLTDAFFQHPDELRSEMEEAGFKHEATIGIEGISYMMRDFDTIWDTNESREFLLDIIQRLKCEPTLIGASPHIMGVAYKK